MKQGSGRKQPSTAVAGGSATPASKLYAEGQRTRVGEIMTRDVVTVMPDTTIEAVIELMLQRDLSRLPVTDSDGKLVGIISKTDLVSEQFNRGDTSELDSAEQIRLPRGISYSEGIHVHGPEALVSELMKAAAVTVDEMSWVRDAAKLMACHHLHGVPVVSHAGRVTGMLSSMDILAWLAGLS